MKLDTTLDELSDVEPEIFAMQVTFGALRKLDVEGQARVLSWLQKKLNVAVSPISASGGNITASAGEAPKISGTTSAILGFESLAELFAAARPSMETEKALVAAAYIQLKSEVNELGGRELNAELNNLGHRIGNITLAIGNLSAKKPALMVQLRKEGKSKQAIKKYKVTVAGFDRVTEMLKTAGVSND